MKRLSIKKTYKAVLSDLSSFSYFTGVPLQSIASYSVNGYHYPLIKIELGTGNMRKKRMLISAGIHGDEPAGVETICNFLKGKGFQKYKEDWELTILPCLNPYGYEHKIRNSYEDKDLNRMFKSTSPPSEVIAAQEILSQPFDVTIELHEDSDSSGYYLYQKEIVPSEPSLGRLVLQAVKKFMPINMDPIIDGMRADRGLIDRFYNPDKMNWWPMALYAAAMGTRLCFTLETAPHFPMKTRVLAHLTAIRTVLENYLTTNSL